MRLAPRPRLSSRSASLSARLLLCLVRWRRARLRAEQEHVSSLGTGKNSLSNALGELEGRLSDAENAALKGGKTAMAKLEGKIRELEAELASTQSRTGEATKAFQRAERKAK